MENPLSEIDSRYGWGREYVRLDLPSNTVFTELVLGVLSNTHGWGSCTVPPGSFRACHEPSWSIGYTLP